MPSTRTDAERSPRTIFVTEHTRRAAGTNAKILLSLHVTEATLRKHKSKAMRERYMD